MWRFSHSFGAVMAVAVVLSACGGNDSPTRTYELGLTVDDSTEEYRFIASETPDIRVGDQVTFEMLNTGAFRHDLQIIDPTGKKIAGADAVAPGDTISLTAMFDTTGIYQLNCVVDNHLTEHNMQALVQVTEPDS